MRTPGFGNTTTIEQLDGGIIHIGHYFNEFVDYFVKIGYVRGKSIRAAQYDWRLAPGVCQCVHTCICVCLCVSI